MSFGKYEVYSNKIRLQQADNYIIYRILYNINKCNIITTTPTNQKFALEFYQSLYNKSI